MKMGDIDFDLNHFFRYVYGGFILCLITVLILPEQSKVLYKALGGKSLGGNVFFILFIISIGTGLYAFYKTIINELLIDGIHFKKPEFLYKHQKKDCVFKYLVNLGLEEKQKLTAFRLVRDKDFDPAMRKIFYLRHSELHVLYITSTACAIGFLIRVICYILKMPACNIWLFILILTVGIVTFLAGLLSEKNLCSDECHYCSLIEETIKGTLKGAKLLKQ